MKRYSSTYDFVAALASRMHRGHHWRRMPLRSGKLGLGCDHSPLEDEAIQKHVDGGAPVGLCPIHPGESTTCTALLDFDSHKGEVPWPQMAAKALTVVLKARERGLQPIAFRSSGGNGIHLLFVWNEPQDAYTVRQTLTEVLAESELKPGTKGVAHGTVEVFPKQNSVPEGGFGNMWVLPFNRESVALDPEMQPIPSVPGMAISAPLVKRDKPTVERSSSAPDAPELSRVTDAVLSLKPRPYDYEEWRSIVFAIHDATEGSEEGERLAQWFNDNVMPHEKGREWLSEQVWPYIRLPQPGAPMITVGSLFHKAGADGWADPRLGGSAPPSDEGFEEIPEAERQKNSAPEYQAIVFDDMTGIDANPPPAREWIAKDWLARGILHAFFARGGKGKSLLMQQLATAVSTGGKWLEQDCVQGKVMGFFCEEDAHELQRRQMSINANLMLTSADTGPRLLLQGRLGHPNNVLVMFDSDNVLKVSRFFRNIVEEVRKHQPDVVILDNIAQMYAGQENDRSQVTQWGNLLSGIALLGPAVVLVGHVAKAEGSQYSGSTAMENVARIRWYLNAEDDGTSTLSIAKTNIGPERELTLRWKDGVFSRVEKGSVEAFDATDGAEREIFEAIGRLAAEKQATSHNARGGNYLPRIMVKRRLTTHSEAILTAVMGRLIAKGDLVPDAALWTRGAGDRHMAYGLGVADHVAARNPLATGEMDGSELL